MRLFQVTFGFAFPPSGNAAVCPSTPVGTRESEVRSPCRATAMACRRCLVRPHRRARRPFELQHPGAAEHGLGEAVEGLVIGVLLAPAG